MEVQEFLNLFRGDIPDINNTEWSFDHYQKWHPMFYKKTLDFHRSVKQSYFEQTYKLIDENNYSLYYGPLSEFSYLGLFNEEDEIKFVCLIRKLTGKIDETEEEYRMGILLDYLYYIADFLLHEYYHYNGTKESIDRA